MPKTTLETNRFSYSKKGLIQAAFGTLLLTIAHYMLGGGELAPGIVFYGFWFLCSMIASLYGTVEGIFSVLLSSLIYLVIQFYAAESNPDFSMSMQFFGAPLLWLFSAVVFGEIRCQHSIAIEQYQEQLKTLTKSNEMLIHNLGEASRTNKSLQDSLKSSQQKLENIIYALLSLINIKPTQILLSLEGAIESILAPEKFSVYANGPGGLEVLISHGWKSKETYPLRIGLDEPLYFSVVTQREIISISQPSQATILQKHGIFAAPLCDPDTNEVFGMLKIEEMEERSLDSTAIIIAQGFCQFIGHVYALARSYQEALKGSIYARQRKVHSDALYHILYRYLLSLAKQLRFYLASFHVVLRTSSENIFFSELHLLVDVIKKILPPQALIFQGKGPSNELNILLPGLTPRQMEALEIQLNKTLHEPSGISPGKVYLTRKMDYIPEELHATI